MTADNPAIVTSPAVREAQARQRAASKNAKRKRDSAQPQKNRAPLQYFSFHMERLRPGAMLERVAERVG